MARRRALTVVNIRIYLAHIPLGSYDLHLLYIIYTSICVVADSAALAVHVPSHLSDGTRSSIDVGLHVGYETVFAYIYINCVCIHIYHLGGGPPWAVLAVQAATR